MQKTTKLPLAAISGICGNDLLVHVRVYKAQIQLPKEHILLSLKTIDTVMTII